MTIIDALLLAFYLSITKTKKVVNRYYTEIVLWLRGHRYYFLGEEK